MDNKKINICCNCKNKEYHRHSFTNPLIRNQTTLSKLFWNLKERQLTSHIKRNFIKKNFDGE